MATNQERALALFVGILDRIGVAYLVVGSVASSIHGVPRMTQDVDMVAAMGPEHVLPLVAAARDAFYVDETAIREAVTRRECFNAIHLDTIAKIDVFIRDGSEWTQREWERRVRSRIGDQPDSPEVHIASAEDMILRKLAWFREGGGISDRQWRDVLGMLQVRGSELDRAYLEEWASRLGLDGLLNRAVRECGP
jgi:hypothetical protein